MRRLFASLAGLLVVFGGLAAAPLQALAAPVIELRATGVITSSISNDAAPFGGTGVLVGKTATLIHTLSYSPGTVESAGATSAAAVFDTISVSVQIDALALLGYTSAAGDVATYALQQLSLPTPASVDSQSILAPGAAFLETTIVISSATQNLFAGLNLLQNLSFTLPQAGIDARFGGTLYDLTNPDPLWDFVVEQPASIIVTVTGLPDNPVPNPAAAWLVLMACTVLLWQRCKVARSH